MSLTLTYGALNLTAAPYLIEFGLDTGAPENVSQAFAFMLQDGEVELSERSSNRTLQFNVLIEGATLGSMDDYEAALIAETEKPLNTITLDPGDSGVAAVYDTFRAQVSLVRDDDWEAARIRRYSVTVRAYPFPRSSTAFASVALPATGTTTTNLDTCGATTGWSATINGVGATVVFAAGPPTVLTVTGSPISGSQAIIMAKTFAATTTALKYLVVDWKPSPVPGPPGPGSSPLIAVGDGVTLPVIAESASPTSGFVRSTFYVAASSLAALTLQWTSLGTATRVMTLDNVAITDVRPGSGTNRQQIRSLTVPGSVRTQGSLAIESATAALGDALVYVYPKDASTFGYSPPMRQFRISGNTVTGDSAQVSGNTEPLTGSLVTFQVPIGLFPIGSYLLMGRLATAGGGTPTITYSSSTVLNASARVNVSASIAITTTTAYQTFALGRLQLPTLDMDPGSPVSGVVMQLTVSSSTTCTYDEFWLFNTTIGGLIRVDCGTGAGTVGGTSRRLFIEPATVTTPRPTVRIGHSADRSDSHYPDSAFPSWQPPEFKPPQVNVLVVTPNATDAGITLSGYARWHTNPAS